MKKGTVLYFFITICSCVYSFTIAHYTETVAGNDSRTSEGDLTPVSPRSTERHMIRLRPSYPKKWRNNSDELRSSETNEGPIDGPTEQTENEIGSTIPRVNPNAPYYERGRMGPWAGQPVQ
jgi:hypothetical protein